MSIRKGDDTDAFDFSWLTVNLDNPEGFKITKAEIRIGTLLRVFNNPVFPLEISLNRNDTSKLRENNMCYMAIYDTKGRKYTCKGNLCFKTEPRVV